MQESVGEFVEEYHEEFGLTKVLFNNIFQVSGLERKLEALQTQAKDLVITN